MVKAKIYFRGGKVISDAYAINIDTGKDGEEDFLEIPHYPNYPNGETLSWRLSKIKKIVFVR